ncbi:hypothetical protein AB0H76_14155 [Nocardia sp. NPDC050712]|uniref:hypothetical protein n=1 Tax=Nocardia sp. NPDC050712 TaxID=3155518 RepID=UPI0033F019D7
MGERVSGISADRVRARVGVVAVVCAAVALLGAPGAEATATHIRVMPDINFGSSTNYGVGCSYTIQALVTDAVAPVYFYDNGIPLSAQRPTGGTALLKWVPATPGPHTISVVQAPDDVITAAVEVRVGTGTHLGYGCLVTGG